MKNIFQVAILPASLTLVAFFSAIAQTAPPPTDNFDSTSWWLKYAVQQAAAVTDPNCKDEIYSHLGRVQALAGDIDGANTSASTIANPQKRVYIHIAAANAAYKQKNQPGYKKSIEQAKSVGLNEKNIAFQISINSAVIEACLDCNDIDAALAYAESTKDQWGLQKIAAHLIERNELKRADNIINNNINASGREFALVIAAETGIREGNLPVAEQTALRLVSIKFKDRVYEKLGVAFAESGNIEKARAAAETISDPALKSSVIAAIAKYQINSGDMNSGKKTLAEITSRDHKIKVYTLIAEKQADAGKIDSAVETIEMMTKMIDKTPMAPDKSKFGTFDDAFKKGSVQTVYLRAAKAAAKAGDMENYNKYIAKATAGVKPIKDSPVWGGVVFTRIIEAQLEAGDIEGAKKSAKELVGDKYNLPWALYNIAKAQIEKDDITGAVTTAQKIADPMNKSFAYGAIASAFVKKNQLADAKKILSGMGNSSWEVQAYRQTAKAFVETGHTKELANWLNDIPSPQARACACIGAVDGIMKSEKENQNKK